MSTTRIAVVTAADTDMCHLALDLIESVKARAPFDVQPMCFDVGLKPNDREAVERRGATVVSVGWDYEGPFPGDWFKALTARPHIPRHIPGFDLYIWIDADCWVQDGSALRELADAARERPVAAACAVHRGYRQVVATSPGAPGIPAGRYQSYLYSELLEPAMAATLVQRPYLNCGVVAARGDSPLWPAWQRVTGELYPRARNAAPPPWPKSSAQAPKPDRLWKGAALPPPFFHTEEVALNVVGHLHLENAAILDARCNWLCSQAIPMINSEGLFVDTAWPHAPIGILHMTADTKQGTWPVQQLDGGSIRVELRKPRLGG